MSFTKVAPAGIGTEPGTSILIGDSLLHSTGIDIGSSTGVGVTIRQHGDATFTGIVTAASFSGSGANLTGIDATAIKHTDGNVKVQATGTGANLTGNLSVSGNLGVGGVLTYEDVTNIDSVGVITARGGIKIGPTAGVAGTFFADGSYVTAGIITATSFSGSGANLTSLPAQATIANNGNDRIITGGSGVNLNGEANLQFDGTDLYVSDKIKHLGDPDTLIEFATDTITFDTAGSERLRINQHGGLRVFAAASDPTGIEAGEIYYNTSTNRLRVYNGSKWLNPDENKDPYASDVVCQFNGDSYTDLTGRHTLTQVGSGGLSNNYMSPVGSTHTYRMAHSNSNGNYMNITGNLGDFRLDDGNWTMEFWVRTTGTNGYSHYFVADGQGSKGTFKGYTNNSSVTEMAYFYSSNGSGVSYNPGGSPFAYNDWQHYAWDRSGSTTRFYLDGVVRASSTAAYPGGVPTLCNIGKWSNEAREFYMDNFRFTRGQARYGGNGFEVPRTKYTSG